MSRAWCAVACLVVAASRARELDPGACAARFDVQRDKIIRTEESRDMGARYLSELDVGARHECRRLCCETDACDVFVYEEKSPGSCYLFNCGPPEDFRCKFTAHGNFSSGVLQLSRRLAELQDQERLAHGAPPLAGPRSVTSTAPPAPRAPDPRPPTPPLEERPRDGPAARCSRYQFSCHTGGECIAVYNACDGVPQCADGSDEAPELGCPAAAPAPAPRVTARPSPAPTRAPPPPAPLDGAEASEARVAEEVRWPSRLAQAQAAAHRHTDVSGESHIFSHKGGLVQEAEAPLPQYPAFDPAGPAPAPWPRRPWPQQSVGVEGVPAEGGGWGGAYVRGEWDAGRRAWPVPPRLDPEVPLYAAPKTMPEMPLLYPSQQHTLRDAPKKGLGLQPATAPPPTSPVAPPSPPAPPPAPHLENSTKKKVLEKQSLAAPQTHAAAAVVAADDDPAVTRVRLAGAPERDGLSERPPAAVLLLVLGLCMTGALGAVVGARARAARRRGRRGKAPLAHDPDYLVNGMYL